MELLFNLNTINKAAGELLEKLKDAKVIAFNGEMGAGKTTFIHAICDVLNVSSPVGSPTFSIINQYQYPGGILCHIDLYRLRDEEEAIRAGVEDCLFSGNICLVEWPGRAPKIFPEDTAFVLIEPLDLETRRIKVTHPFTQSAADNNG